MFDGRESEEAGTERILGRSPAVVALRRRLARVARSDATVFLTGESGTGKELCAEAIHAASARAGGPFVAVNCGAIPAELIEAELFGCRRGAFTGAHADRPGAARAADGGVLFLDELCELPLALQSRLLRFLESGEVRAIGEDAPRRVDVRTIAATNRDPAAEVAAGRLREDLYFRLHVLPVEAPPLRDRGDDALGVAEAMLARFAAEEGRAPPALTAEARAAILAHRWPGNLRELRNAVRRAVVLGEGARVAPADLGLVPAAPAAAPGRREAAAAALLGLPFEAIERLVFEAAIARFGSAPKAARALGLSPSTLYRKQEGWAAG